MEKETYKSPYAKMDELNKGRSDLDRRLDITTPEAFTEWLIVSKGLNEKDRDNVVSNLKRAFEGQYIKGGLMPQRFDIDFKIKLFGRWTILHFKSTENF